MRKEISSLNIPEVTVNDFVEKFTLLYKNADAKGVPFKALPTPFLWGAPGVGKSNGAYQLARKLEAETGKKVIVTDVRLLLFNPADLRGLPTANAGKTLAVWLRPQIFMMNESPDVINLLFLDELSAAPQSVQAAAYQICLDRRIGEHELPANCIVIAAGNRVTDRSVAYKMPKALANRMMHFDIISDYAAWKKWAVSADVSPEIIAFLGYQSNRLCAEPDISDLAYTTPRSWEFVSTLLKTVSSDPEEIQDLIAACIGMDTTLEFVAFCKGAMNMPRVDDILAGRCKAYPKGHDVMFALISALVAKVKEKGDKLTAEELENVCAYVQHLPQDFVMSFMKDINALNSINKKLMRCTGFQNWLNKNKVYL